MNRMANYSSLISVLKQMEVDMGLSDLSEPERLVVAAISSLQEKLDETEFVPSKAIMQHELCAKIPAPTFFRALKELLRTDTISMPEGRKKGLYRLS